ncbi:MFS transporter [Belliella sp. DSM 111904]|uniref:MFS transporter n=1 Tax=Belliella filtrata TaxID=2923435 RepID=A0ABS9UZ69_9BACT|nr:MFS transporter [Belliella filtrata]MCH7409461.1 MFS transporter [Belliella filtrata]
MAKKHLILALIFLIFFVISLLTNILGPIIPDIIESYSLSLGLAGFLPFSFFVAYGVMSIPAGLLVEKYREKKILILAFSLSAIGALLFALLASFEAAFFSLFIIGVGMAMLQVVINPLLRTAGGEVNFAFYSVMGQLAFGVASFLSPQLYSYLVQHIHKDVIHTNHFIIWIENFVPKNLTWISVYWVFALVSMVMVIMIMFVRFPQVDLKDDEKVELGGSLKSLLKMKMVWFYFFGIFCYVGCEQGIANWISKFLQDYHDLAPATTGATTISYFWGLLTIGCLLGLVMLKLLDSKLVLKIFSLGAMISLFLALVGTHQVALIAFPLAGFFLSVMWSIIISLALNSVSFAHGTFAGILCSAIVGGAVFPLIVGSFADLIGLKAAMFILFLPLTYIFSIGVWAKPLISNATLKKV